MAEYIKRKDVQNMLDNAQIITDAEGEYFGYCTEEVDINSIPAADVRENVRGWWLRRKSWSYGCGMGETYGYWWACSKCNNEVKSGYGGCDYKYCPNCGAYMRGKYDD